MKTLLLSLLATLLIACGPSTQKLDEAPLYDGPQFRLRLVRYYENLPLHYSGEVFTVQCASAQTRGAPAHKTQEAGWVTLGRGGAIGAGDAAALAARERPNYLVFDERTLAWVGNGINVSFDACGSFNAWYPTALPAALIVPADKPDYCKPRGTADCAGYDFIDGREPRYRDLRVSPAGAIAFVMESTALRDGKAVRVESDDHGRTWRVAAF